MARTIFSHEMRLAMCANCGAPLEVAVAGGQEKCSYCGRLNHIVRRDETQDLAEARSESQMSEGARIDVLRSQDGRPLVAPPDLARYGAGGVLLGTMLQPAISDWLATRARIQQEGHFAEQERLFHLTLLIAPHLGDRHGRALVENAVEVLPDARHRQILRCRLVHHAVLAGDLDAARDWLEPCNPRPVDLRMDTAYRLAASYVATAEGRHAEVLALLGNRPGDVPIADGHDAEAGVLRANAIERSGQASAAAGQLLEAMSRDPRNVAVVRILLHENRALGLCAASYPVVHAQITSMLEAAMRPTKAASCGCILSFAIFPIAGLALMAAAVLGLLGSDSGVVVNAIVHPLIWLVILPLVLMAAAAKARTRKIRLRDHGVITIAHVLSCAERITHGKSSTTVSQDLVLEIEVGGTRVHTTTNVHQSTAVPLGPYPCLIDPAAPTEHVTLKLQPLT